MKRYLFLILVGIVALVITACGAKSEENEQVEKNEAAETESSTITVTHELGETDVEKNPKKVVVFDFGILDTLDELGIEVTALPQANIPPYLEKFEDDEYENVGTLKEPDFEKIAEIDPDLIIISARQAELYDQFQELAPTVNLGLDYTRYMDSFKENMDIVGEIFDKEDEIAAEVAQIEEDIADLNEKASSSDINALIVLANDDKISAYGPNSRFGLIHDVFGITPADDHIEASTHGQNVSFEYVVEKDPDYLYVIDRGAAIEEGNTSAKQVVENKLVKNMDVYKNDNIVYLDPNYWYLSGGGLVSVKEMIQEIDDSLNE